MKLKIKQNVLMEHLNYVIKGISNKNLIPILNCIKFELTDEGLYLMSTDNEIAIKTFINKKEIEEVEKKGDIDRDHPLNCPVTLKRVVSCVELQRIQIPEQDAYLKDAYLKERAGKLYDLLIISKFFPISLKK